MKVEDEHDDRVGATVKFGPTAFLVGICVGLVEVMLVWYGDTVAFVFDVIVVYEGVCVAVLGFSDVLVTEGVGVSSVIGVAIVKMRA